MSFIRSTPVLTPIIAARRVGSLTLTISAFNNITFDTEDLDLFNAWNGTTFTVPITGNYSAAITAYFSITGTVTAMDTYTDYTVNASGSNRFGNRLIGNASVSTTYVSSILPIANWTAGDAIVFRQWLSFSGGTGVSIPASTPTSLIINRFS